MFAVSAAGVQADATIFNDSWQDESWDAVWESAVRIDAEGWTLEMRVPYSQLRFPSADRHTFGINAMRYIRASRGDRGRFAPAQRRAAALRGQPR
jgi:hypothetical protein